MSSPVDTTFVSGTTITSSWLNGVNDHVNNIEADPHPIYAQDTQLAASSGASLIGFTQAGTGAVIKTVQDKLRETVSVKDFGAVGDGVTNDTAAISSAVTYVLGLSKSPTLYFPAGHYILTAFPTITNAITFRADNPRDTQLLLSGTTTVINVQGSGTRATDVVFDSIGINGSSMTNGYCLSVDFAQNVLLNNVLINNPYNGIYVRQTGNITFRDCEFDYIRGTVGVDLYGDNTTRNGENDQIDLVIFDNTTIQSNLPASGGTNSSILLRIDGRVHTIQTDGLRLLNGGVGLQTKNTPGLASNLIPRFLIGSSLEVENMYAECLDLQSIREFTPAFLFAVGSHTADGIKLSSNVARFSPANCSINSNQLHGLNSNGAASVLLNKPLVYNNSLVGNNVKSGVYASGSGLLQIEGGLSGKETTLPAYTENQKYGIELDGAFSGRLVVTGCDLRSNATGAIFDNTTTSSGSNVSACPGYNPVGTSLQVVGASPYVYTSGLTLESINLYGGTGVVSTISGVAIANASPCSFVMQPRQSVTITYATVPTMAINKA